MVSRKIRQIEFDLDGRSVIIWDTDSEMRFYLITGYQIAFGFLSAILGWKWCWERLKREGQKG